MRGPPITQFSHFYIGRIGWQEFWMDARLSLCAAVGKAMMVTARVIGGHANHRVTAESIEGSSFLDALF